VQLQRTSRSALIVVLAVAAGLLAGGMLLRVHVERQRVRLEQALDRAEHLLHMGESAKAEKVLRRALRSSPKSLALRDMLANVYEFSGKKEKAFEQRRLAVELNPRSPDAYFMLGMLCLSEGRHKEAISVLNQGRSVIREHRPARQVLARCYWHEGQPKKAMEEFRSILADFPDDKAALQGIKALERDMAKKKALAAKSK